MIDSSLTNKGRQTSRAVIVSGVLFLAFPDRHPRVAILSRSSEKRTPDRRLSCMKVAQLLFVKSYRFTGSSVVDLRLKRGFPSFSRIFVI